MDTDTLCIYSSSTSAAQKHINSYLSPYIISPGIPINCFCLCTLLTMKTIKENLTSSRKKVMLRGDWKEAETMFCFHHFKAQFILVTKGEWFWFKTANCCHSVCYVVDWREALVCQDF